jgi:hypothetical protein
MLIEALALLVAPAAPLEVEWVAPAGCPGAAEVKAAVERTLGPPADRERAPIRAVGRVEPSAAGVRLQLEVHEGAAVSRRELEGATCGEVTDAAALILAMAIDPRVALSGGEGAGETGPGEESVTSGESVTASEGETAPESVPVPESETATESTAPSPASRVEPTVASPAETSRRPSRLHFVARAMAGVGLGPLPSPSASLGLAAAVGGRLWRAEAVAHYWPPVEGDAPDDPSRSARASLWSVGARGCVVPEVRRAAFPVCTGVDAGIMRAEGREGVADPQTARTPWAAVVLGAGAEWWPIRFVGLGARLDGHAAVFRPQFITAPSGRIHQAGAVGLQLLGGLLVRAP